MRTALYRILTGSAFNCLQHQRYLLVIPDGATSSTTSKLVRQHKAHKTEFYITKSCGDALKQHLLTAFVNDYVEIVKNASVGFAKTTTLELLNHLYDSYETITPSVI